MSVIRGIGTGVTSPESLLSSFVFLLALSGRFLTTFLLLSLPSGKKDCTLCAEVCPRYCEELCAVDVREKPVSKVLTVRPPRYRRDPDRLVPRIVHQTWFEQVTPGKYPNMNRLAESWRRSGWEYRFWDDASAADFLSGHFPPEVREAYDAIIPGAFRADLFRYCVLLVLGGVYSDMDVMLESNLDAAVPPDVGFMTPFDAPGSKPDHRMCLWNGSEFFVRVFFVCRFFEL